MPKEQLVLRSRFHLQLYATSAFTLEYLKRVPRVRVAGFALYSLSPGLSASLALVLRNYESLGLLTSDVVYIFPKQCDTIM